MLKSLRGGLLSILLLSFTSFLFGQKDTSETAPDSLDREMEDEPVFTVTADMLESNTGEQEVPGLLRASGDVFVNKASYNFSSARFRIRGYEGRNTKVMLNGTPFNHPELGFAIWAYWGGLNDITRYSESRNGIRPNPYGFGSIGGYTNLDMRASSQRAGTRVSYAITNRNYRHRLMATHSTGMMDNGWAFTVSGSGRYSEEGYVPGTFFRGGSYFFSAEKKLNEDHSINFVGFGAPAVQGRQGLSTQEAYDLADNNFYNPYWGYQAGEKRNSRIRNAHQPILLLSHYWDVNDKTKLTSTLSYQFGRYGSTRLNWYDTKDPRPDYYRYRPSYYEEEDPARYESLKKKWLNNEEFRQIDWDRMYFANSKNLYTVEDVNGEEGNDVTGNRSKYIVEDNRSDPKRGALDMQLRHKASEDLTINGGLNLMGYESRNFKVVNDLLGGDFWVDVNEFAQRDFEDPERAQFDLNDPNDIVKEGEKFGYDYSIRINKGDAFVQGQYELDKVEAFLALNLSHTSFWRVGHNKNGLFPEESYGKSEQQNFTNYGAKGGVTYKITGRHYVSANGQYSTRAPLTRNSFVSPRTRGATVPGLTSEKILSADVNYRVRYPRLKGRVTAYYTEAKDKVWSRSFYHDELQSFVNYSMTGVDKTYKGVELGWEYKMIPQLSVTGAVSKAQFLWSSRPNATITVDNSSEVLAEDRKVYLKNYRIGGMPQTAGTIGLKYNSSKYWFAGVDFTYFDDIYLPLNPDRRTEAAVDRYVESDPQWKEIIAQEKLESDYTIDLIGGKSWKLSDKYYLSLFLSVDNILDNTDMRIGGYENLRYDEADIDRFPARYSYMYGRTYYGMVTLRF